MIRPRLIALTLAMALAVGTLAPAGPAFAAAPSCPGRTFDAFLTAFAESAEVQRAHSANPLVYGEIDPEAQPEPAMVTRRLTPDKVPFPVMPGREKRNLEGVEFRKTAKPGGAIEVLLARPDTGYQLRYLFRLAGACWQLTEMADESM